LLDQIVLNNPLSHTDPSGHFIGIVVEVDGFASRQRGPAGEFRLQIPP
jgi:hypothetical protein